MSHERKLRSSAWYERDGIMGSVYRSSDRKQGVSDEDFGKPVIAILNTWSDFTPCNGHFRELAQHVADGVREAGGWPREMPIAPPLGESLVRPTALFLRNLASMVVEESIRANPIDGVVLLVGCDKTTPALLMGAASCNLPTIAVSGGPMVNGCFRGEVIGSGTHNLIFDAKVRRGEMTLEEFRSAETAMSPSTGHCNTMGTASTMASVVEALGVGLPHNAAIPAPYAERSVLAHAAGKRIVEMVREDIVMSKILTREAFENAIRTVGAIGGSTNAVIHLLALAGRIGVPLTLDDWDRIGRNVPCIVNLMPSGGKYLMEDFYRAGGLPVVLERLGRKDLLHKDVLTVNGKTIWENVKDARCFDVNVIQSMDFPFRDRGGLAVLRGNLAPDGAVIKPSAASEELLTHRGPACVFENIEDYKKRIDDPDLTVTEDSILVLKNCGPVGYPGMPEVGNMTIPKKLLKKGVTDMVRISDARMSGTAFGTVVLHVAPEAAIGGPLAFVRSGDMIELNVEQRKLHLDVDDKELEERGHIWRPPSIVGKRGLALLHAGHVLQADKGCDYDFLVGGSGADVPKDSH